MIRKYWEVICDTCGNAINHYHQHPPYRLLKQNKIVLSKGKHYCNISCRDKNRKLKEIGIPPKSKDMGILPNSI